MSASTRKPSTQTQLANQKDTNTPICFWIFDNTVASKTSKIFISQNRGFPIGIQYHCFYDDESWAYHPLCDDFGPMNLSSIASFVEHLEKATIESKFEAIVYCITNGRRPLTNAAFLLGAHMILKQGKHPKDVAKHFEEIGDQRFESYRDATYGAPCFRLDLVDCWSGLQQAIDRHWLALPTRSYPHVWGMIYLDEYLQYDNPLNADLHEVVPGKFVAFQGPHDLKGGQLFRDDDSKGTRRFSPKYYVDILHELGVTAVVRLNEAHYQRSAFADAGFEHHDLYFDDCTAPPPDVIARFFAVADAAPGLVAVHRRAGLGRTGTLIAIYMMRSLGFSARAAMGWLRIMRPGSVIGEQQHYLCAMEARGQGRSAEAGDWRGGGADLKGRRTAQAAQVGAAMERRCVAGGRGPR